MNTNIEVGMEVQCMITGFKGIVVSKTEYLHGCVRCGVQPKKLDKDGNPIKELWFDAPQLKIINKKKMKATQETGGPRPSTPRKTQTPRR